MNRQILHKDSELALSPRLNYRVIPPTTASVSTYEDVALLPNTAVMADSTHFSFHLPASDKLLDTTKVYLKLQVKILKSGMCLSNWFTLET